MNPILIALESEITTALAGLDSHQTQATPSAHPEKWSIQQIADHLLKTYASTIPLLRGRVDKQTPTRTRATLLQRFTQTLVLTFGRFPHGRRSPDSVAPSASPTPLSGFELAEKFRAHFAELDAVATLAQALFGKQRCATHQVLGPLSIHQWCTFHLIHGRHHINQIREIRAKRQI